MFSYEYILNCCDVDTGIFYNILVTEGNVFTRLEAERTSSSPKMFAIRKVLIPETDGYVISIDNDHNFITLH